MSTKTKPREGQFTGCRHRDESERDYLHRHAYEYGCFIGRHTLATDYADHCVSVYDKWPDMYRYWNHNTEWVHWITEGAD